MGNALNQKLEVGERRFLTSCGTLTTVLYASKSDSCDIYKDLITCCIRSSLFIVLSLNWVQSVAQ